MLLILIAASWIAGALFGSFYVPDVALTLTVTLLCAIAAVAARPRGSAYLLPLCLAVALLGTARYGAAAGSLDHLDLQSLNGGSPVALRGVVAADPDVRDGWTSVTLGNVEVHEDGEYRARGGAALLRMSQWGDYRSGDRLELVGRLEAPPVLDGFSYRDYLLRRGIVSLIDFPEIKGVTRGQSNDVLSPISALRALLWQALASSLPEPQAGLAQGMLIGVRSNLSKPVLESFSRTSTTHILAVSGFNVALVAAALALVTRRLLRRGSATVVALAGVATYTLLVGGSPSAVRAAIMGSLVILGAYYGRQTHLVTSLLLAGSLMVLHNPFVLWDVGFQLSFLATGGLGVFAPLLVSRLTVVPTFLREPLAFTLCAQLATMPVIAVDFNQISIVALPANLLVLPAIPLATLLSGLTALAAAVWPALGVAVGSAAWLVISYVLTVVEALAALPWASLPVGQVPMALAWVCYLVMGLVAVLAWRPQVLSRLTATSPTASRVRFALTGCLAFAAALSWMAVLATPPDELSVSFLNVGQGDATLIRTAHRTVLIDGGPKTGVLLDALGRRLPFWRRDIDLVVVTHPDADHVAGLVEVPRRYHVGQVLQSELAEPSGVSGPYAVWLDVIREQGVTVVMANAGQTIRLEDDVKLTVLYPLEGPRAESADDNESPVVLRLTCPGVSFLMLGDADVEVQRRLVDSAVDLKSTVLMVPHHGAEGAVAPEFLRAVDPSLAVISVGSDNHYGHPAASTLRELDGRRVYRTDVQGTVEVAVKGGQCWVRTGDR